MFTIAKLAFFCVTFINTFNDDAILRFLTVNLLIKKPIFVKEMLFLRKIAFLLQK